MVISIIILITLRSILYSSRKEIKMNVRNHLRCNGYYNDSCQGTARHARGVATIVVMMRMSTIIVPRRGARLHWRCKGCHDDTRQGTAGDATLCMLCSHFAAMFALWHLRRRLANELAVKLLEAALNMGLVVFTYCLQQPFGSQPEMADSSADGRYVAFLSLAPGKTLDCKWMVKTVDDGPWSRLELWHRSCRGHSLATHQRPDQEGPHDFCASCRSS